MARTQAERQLFDLLVTRDFDPQTLDSQGKPAATPEDAKLFSFDYQGESGKDYGTVVVMLNDDNSMTVYTGDNTGKSMEGDDKRGWFDFQAQLKRFAMKNLMSFNLQNLNKLKYSMQGQAALKEGLFESWQGKKDVSYNADATQARLMIKHKRNIGEGEARYRNIQALFIETADGERFKLPFNKLSGGRAMLEHVRQGGRPYDMRGAHIATIVNEMNLLARFKRANQSRIFEGEVANLVEQANNYYATLQHSLKSLGSKTGYTKYFESWNPADITDQDVIIEDLRHMFVEQNIDSRVEQALPLLAKLQQEQAMKEINVFEGWMNLLSEGTWALPDSPEKQQQLVTLLSAELPVGPDATNATEQLYDILGDDELFDKLGELAEHDANADARTVILDRLEEMKSNPSVAQVIGKLKIESTPQAPAEQPVHEGESCHVCHESACSCDHKQVKEGFNTYEMDTTPCPVCYETELTYDQGADFVQCGSCATSFDTDGNVLDDEQNLDIELDEAADTVEKDPTTGKVKSWSHEGDWEKTKKVKGKAVDPRGEVTHMSDKARRETEKLDELDKDTLGSYIKKASSDRAMRNFDQGVDTGTTFQDREPKFDWHNSRKDDQRRSGIHKAVSRLVKEDGEPSLRQRVDIATQDQLDHQDAMSARDFDRNQGRIERHRGNHAAGVDIERWLKPYQTLVDNNFKPVETEDRFEYLMQVALKLKGTNAGFSGDTGMSHAARMFGLQHEEQKLVANLVRNAPKVSELERATVSEDATDSKSWMAQVKAKYPTAQFIQAKMPGAPIRAMVDGKAVAEFKTPNSVKESASDLKGNVLAVLETIYRGALAGEEMIDDVADELNDYYDDVMACDDTTLQQAFSLMQDEGQEAEGDPQLMASIAKNAISILSQSGINETTALTGQYGHSGKLQAVKPQDQDMMDRIKFLAGISK